MSHGQNNYNDFLFDFMDGKKKLVKGEERTIKKKDIFVMVLDISWIRRHIRHVGRDFVEQETSSLSRKRLRGAGDIFTKQEEISWSRRHLH